MKLLKTYGFSLLLIFSIVVGLLLGKYFPEAARAVRPIGDLFLNLIFMVIVPLVFFTLSSAVASSVTAGKLSRISWAMALDIMSASWKKRLAPCKHGLRCWNQSHGAEP